MTIKGNMFSSFLKFSYKQNSAIRTWFLAFGLTKKNLFLHYKNLVDQKIHENHFVAHKEPSLRPPKNIRGCRPGRAFQTLILEVSHTLGRDHTHLRKQESNILLKNLQNLGSQQDGIYNSIRTFFRFNLAWISAISSSRK